jgi:prepilin-type N-terminal cleavage/methylation domain-containing protein
MKRRDSSASAGFSLVELLVAMTITLIIAGSVFGLLTVGQDAFKREPERSDLQQNIRVSMDLIMKDVASAGMQMDPWVRAFRPGLDGTGALGSDVLEIVGSDGTCNALRAAQTGAATLNLVQGAPPCFTANASSMMVVTYSPAAGVSRTGWGLVSGLAAGATSVAFAGTQPAGADAVPLNANTSSIGVAKLVRYEIFTPPLPDGVPSLYRSDTGGYNAAGAFQPVPAAAGNWQLIARGIENLQVDYRVGPNAWTGAGAGAPAVTLNDPTTIISEVRVTVSGRGIKSKLAGQTAGPGVATLRAQLVSVCAPRAALFGMGPAQKPPAAKWSMSWYHVEWM